MEEIISKAGRADLRRIRFASGIPALFSPFRAVVPAERTTTYKMRHRSDGGEEAGCSWRPHLNLCKKRRFLTPRRVLMPLKRAIAAAAH